MCYLSFTVFKEVGCCFAGKCCGFYGIEGRALVRRSVDLLETCYFSFAVFGMSTGGVSIVKWRDGVGIKRIGWRHLWNV